MRLRRIFFILAVAGFLDHGTALLAADGPAPNQSPSGPAQRVLDRWLAAEGGEDALAAVKTYEIRQTMDNDGSTATVTQLLIGTGLGHFRNETAGPTGTIVQVYDGITGWQSHSRWGIGPLDGNSVKSLIAQTQFWNPVSLLRKYPVHESKGTESLEGRACTVLSVLDLDGVEERWDFEQASGQLVRAQRLGRDGKTVESTVDFSDFRAVGALTLPFTRARRSGSKTVLQHWSEFLINPRIDEDQFAPTADQSADMRFAAAILQRYAGTFSALAHIPQGAAWKIQETVDDETSGLQSKVSIFLRQPASFLIDNRSPGFGQVAIGFDGRIAWTNSDLAGLRILTREQALQSLLQMHLFPQPLEQALPLRKRLGIRMVAGRHTDALMLANSSEQLGTFFFDQETGRLLRYVPAAAPDAAVTTLDFADFRAVNGAAIPHRLTIIHPGGQIVTTIDSIDDQATAPTSLFAPSAGVRSAFDRAELAGATIADVPFFFSRGTEEAGQKDPAAAIADFDMALSLDPSRSDILNDRGVSKYAVGNYGGALADYEASIALHPDFYLFLGNRGLAKISLKDFAGAIADETKAIELKPDYVFAYINRAKAMKAKGYQAEAIADWRKVVALDPSNWSGWYEIGIVESAKSDYKAAVADYTKALAANPDDAFVLRDRADARRRDGDRDGAVADYEKTLKLKPDYFDALNELGIVEKDKGDLKAAETNLNEAIRVDPKSAYGYMNRGTVKRLRKDYDGAIADESEAIALMPGSTFAYNERGIAEMDKNAFDKAMADFDHATQIDAKYTFPYFNRGLIWIRRQEPQKAVLEYDAALALNPKYERAYFERAIAKTNLGDWDGADADYTKDLALSPRSIAYLDRGDERLKAGHADLALIDFDAAIGLDPKVGAAYSNRAEARRLQGDLAGAFSDVNRALELLPGQAASLYLVRARLDMAAHGAAAAIDDCRKALDVNPALGRAYRALADYEFAQGSYDGSISDCNRAIKLDSGSALADDYWGRAAPEFAKGDSEAALTDYIAVVGLGGNESVYGRFFVHLISLRLHRPTDSAGLAGEVDQISAEWPKNIARYLSGSISETELLNRAGVGPQKVAAEHLCEAYFYAGMACSVGGDSAGARSLFEKCVGTNITNFLEFKLARAELARMGSVPNSSR